MTVDYTRGVVGRDPVAKVIVRDLLAAHPGWSDAQVSDRINQEYTSPVITVDEVAHWRREVAQ